MKKIVLLGLLVLGLSTSCERNNVNQENLEIENTVQKFQGLTFTDWDSFYALHTEINQLSSEEEVVDWSLDNNENAFFIKAFTTDDDAELEIADQLTFALMAIMNVDYKFKVADQTISFVDGVFMANSDLDSELKKIDNLQITTIELSSENKNATLNSRINLSNNGHGTAGTTHKDFYRERYLECYTNDYMAGLSSRQMRYVQQLKATMVGNTAFLWIETKLYWRNSKGKLRYAELEQRNYDYNINGTVSIKVGPFGSYITKNIAMGAQDRIKCTRSRWNRKQIASAFPVNNLTPWNINLSGSIKHQINGDYYSWTAPVNW
ncbi:hypothetical protein [uncultured Maribacter sp.]|uniref:hypothetical protein n=1 Tax=uncultured Maribacter sp. TaxID=431308 RepID=UPI00262B9D59|nr:hypothetical protein [uncultured Maribacter sp.]